MSPYVYHCVGRWWPGGEYSVGLSIESSNPTDADSKLGHVRLPKSIGMFRERRQHESTQNRLLLLSWTENLYLFVVMFLIIFRTYFIVHRALAHTRRERECAV